MIRQLLLFFSFMLCSLLKKTRKKEKKKLCPRVRKNLRKKNTMQRIQKETELENKNCTRFLCFQFLLIA